MIPDDITWHSAYYELDILKSLKKLNFNPLNPVILCMFWDNIVCLFALNPSAWDSYRIHIFRSSK